jgi:hypothetical protein
MGSVSAVSDNTRHRSSRHPISSAPISTRKIKHNPTQQDHPSSLPVSPLHVHDTPTSLPVIPEVDDRLIG